MWEEEQSATSTIRNRLCARPPRRMLGGTLAAGSGAAARPPGGAQQQYAVLHGDRVLLSCGYWDGSIRCHAGRAGCAAPSRSPGDAAAAASAFCADWWCRQSRRLPPSAPQASKQVRPCPATPRRPPPAVEDGRLLQSLCYHRDVATCVAVSPDGRTVASGSRDTTAMIWDVNTAFIRGASAGGLWGVGDGVSGLLRRSPGAWPAFTCT